MDPQKVRDDIFAFVEATIEPKEGGYVTLDHLFSEFCKTNASLGHHVQHIRRCIQDSPMLENAKFVFSVKTGTDDSGAFCMRCESTEFGYSHAYVGFAFRDGTACPHNLKCCSGDWD